MNLLLVDDEPLLIESLLLIDWKGLGFQNIYSATSGQKAIELSNSFEIDLMISDIRMPNFTGLELYEQLLVNHPKTLCIYISGYEQFAYAQQAIKLHALDFLTKPVRDNQLVESVKKAITEIKKRKTGDNSNQLFRKEITHYLYSNSSLSELLKIPFFKKNLEKVENSPLFLLCIEYESTDISLENMIQSTLHLMKNSAIKYMEFQFLIQNKNKLFFIVKRKKDISKHLFDLILTNIQLVITQTLLVRLKLYYSKPVESAEDLKTWLNTFQSQVYNLPNNSNSIIPVDYNENVPITSIVSELRREPTFPSLFEINDFKSIYLKLNVIQEEVLNRCIDSNAVRDEILFSLINGFSSLISIKNSTLLTKMRDLLIQVNQERHFNNIDGMMKILKEIIHEFESEVNNQDTLTIVERVNLLVRKNIDKNITLSWLAEATNYHPAYLSKIYKEKTNTNIKDMIFKERMNYAKKLLHNPELKIYDVSHLVGFSNVSYFSAQFKSKFGITPIDYRYRILNKYV